jgi:catalase
MATNNNGPFDGAGSILSTIGGPSDPTPPESLGAVTPESERLLEKVSEDAELAARIPASARAGLRSRWRTVSTARWCARSMPRC